MADLKVLETFVEVLDRLSFADAARSLGVPPSTVTMRVKSLETQLGVRLLERSTRSVAPTPEGRLYAQHCRRALAELALGRSALGAAQEARGLVRVSIPVAFSAEQFAKLVGAFRQGYPDISVQVFMDDRPASFVEDGIDLALRGRDPGGNGLIARRLTESEVLFVAKPGHLNDTSLPVLRPLSRGAPNDAGGGVATRSLRLACAFAVHGQARAYLPQPVCEDAISSGKLETGEGPDGRHQPLGLFLVYHDKRHQPKRVQLFKEHLISQLSSPS